MTTKELLLAAKAAAPVLAAADTDKKNRALLAMADGLIAHADAILAANALDLESAQGHVSPVMLDRLALNNDRIQGMADGIREVVKLPDPVGRILELNPEHEAVKAMHSAMTEDPLKAKDYASLLMYQAMLMAELPLEDPFAYTELVCRLMV